MTKTENMNKYGCGWSCDTWCHNGQECKCPDCKNFWFFHDRRLAIHSFDEYGNPEKFILKLPIFFHNRPNAKIIKVDMIDKNDNIIDTISKSEKAIECTKEFGHILTLHEHLKEITK